MKAFEKPKIAGQGIFSLPEPTSLSKKSKPGEYVYWYIGDEKRTGILQSWQHNKATIKGIIPSKVSIVVEV